MLYQLIGPPDSGKTRLRESLVPDAVCIDFSLYNGYFNPEMLHGDAFYFMEAPPPRGVERLREWLASPTITIHRIQEYPVERPNPGIWIYEGLEPLPIENSLIWRIEKHV